MIINSQPDTTKLQAAFEPLVYTVTEAALNTTISAALEVKVLVDGNQKEILYYDSINTETIGSDLNCHFKIDISEAVQKWLPNIESVFVAAFVSANYVASVVKGTIDTQIAIVPYLPNTEGLLVRVPFDETIPFNFQSIGAYLKETQTIDSLIPFVVSSDEQRFLTNKPIFSNIGVGEKEFLWYFNARNIAFLGAIYIRIFNKANGVIGADFFNINATADKILCMNVGPESIMSIAQGASLSDIDYYEVRLVDADGYNITEVRKYYVQHNCNGYRLHFLNQFGFYDSVSLQTDFKENNIVKSDYFEKNRDKSHVYSRSQTRLSVYSQKTYDAQITNLSDAQVSWLQELLLSPSVFWEKDGVLLPVNIEDGSNVLKQTAEINELKLSFSLSNRTFSQRG